MSIYRGQGSRKTPQNEPILGENQVKNNADGYVYAIDKWAQLDRFLILGTEAGTYYVDEDTLTKEAATNVLACIKEDGVRTVERIKEISLAGRALKNDPAIFALAMCMGLGDEATRRQAELALSSVCRIGTHLFHFAAYVELSRGWGKVLKRAVASWYDDKDANRLAYDLVKYRQRDGWGHNDLIQLSHPTKHGDLYDWVLGARPGKETITRPPYLLIEGYEEIKTVSEPSQAAHLIDVYSLPREAVPTALLKSREVWEALLVGMPIEAMVRNLGNMGSIGLLMPMSDTANKVVEYLSDGERIRRSRLHPLRILNALIIYQQGHGRLGGNTWPVIPQVVDALGKAFYMAFPNVTPTGKKFMLGLDVSGSMGAGFMEKPRNKNPRKGTEELSVMSCAQATGALSLVTANIESAYHIMGFAHEFTELGITANTILSDAFKRVQMNNFGATDCALPMQYAQKNKIDCDVFVVYTDNETWFGQIHPSQALRAYREFIGHDAKLVVIGMRVSNFSIADPNDAGMMDVVGFDTNVPEAIAEFTR